MAPVLTADATRFVGALTFSALASEPVHDSLWSDADPIPHTRLGRSADLIVVAPATARCWPYAAGISDDLLTATLLATRAPVVVCPAMHTEMWEHPAVRDNLATLRRRGVRRGRARRRPAGRRRRGRRPPGRAGGHPGRRRPRPRRRRTWPGGTVLVTAGGTREPIDPVRFLGNRSSGKQGDALAAEAAARGAEGHPGHRHRPAGAGRRRAWCGSTPPRRWRTPSWPGPATADVVVMAAAVADFRPKAAADQKLQKADGVPDIVLEPTTDILAELGRRKRRRPGAGRLRGGDRRRAGRRRGQARRKGLDLIVANDVTAPGVGFGHDTNAATLLDADGDWTEVPLTTKRELARIVLDAVGRPHLSKDWARTPREAHEHRAQRAMSTRTRSPRSR